MIIDSVEEDRGANTLNLGEVATPASPSGSWAWCTLGLLWQPGPPLVLQNFYHLARDMLPQNKKQIKNNLAEGIHPSKSLLSCSETAGPKELF